MRHREPLDETICRVLRHGRIAVVGLSDKEWRDSHRVARYMLDRGYTIVPVNPEIPEVFGLKSYPDLQSAPPGIEIVNVFRRIEHVPEVVQSAIEIHARAVWTQYGLVDEDAGAQARAAGLEVVMDRCLMVEHARHLGS